MYGSIGSERWREIRQIHKEHAGFYRILRGIVLLSIGVFIGRLIYGGNQAPDFELSIFTSILGLAATALIFDELNRQRSEQDYKRQLADDLASNVDDVAKNARFQLWRREWLSGEQGVLKGANLRGANLQNFDLNGANLRKADLTGANLEKADLSGANLEGAILRGAKMQEAYLGGANLQKADLTGANLQGARLTGANLQGANLFNVNLQEANLLLVKLQGAILWYAKLQGANLNDTKFDHKTALPVRGYWTSETIMERFTDPTRPDFLQPIARKRNAGDDMDAEAEDILWTAQLGLIKEPKRGAHSLQWKRSDDLTS